jgi:hypothetical protein
VRVLPESDMPSVSTSMRRGADAPLWVDQQKYSVNPNGWLRLPGGSGLTVSRGRS